MKRTLLVCCLLAAFYWVAQAQQTPGSLRSSDLPPNPERTVLPPPTCPPGTLFGQTPTHPDSFWIAWWSDIQFPYLVFDNFWSLNDTICDVHWWGLSLGFSASGPPFLCDEDPMTFEIKFYENTANGTPGTVVCTYTVTLFRQATGHFYGIYPLYYWSTVLNPCCALTAGWVSIQGVSAGNPGAPDCFFLWMDSPQGDNNAFQVDAAGNLFQLNDDLAFCLTSGEEPADMDMGDIVHPANMPIGYPTLIANPGHLLSGIAWLGAGITGEPAPNIFELDPFDDGVVFPRSMFPCTPTWVTVTVTAGPNYVTGMPLFLSAWKDGNDDGDFCDSLCPDADGVATVSEWIIQDVPVTPGQWTFTFMDPGLRNVPPYAGWFRFRLTSVPVGPLGFGLTYPSHCPGTFGVDQLGEVEDYWKPDYQLAVELTSFDAASGANEVVLTWVTASETDNDRFEIERNGRVIVRIPTQGNDASGHSYTYRDRDVSGGTTYTYALASVDLSGNREVLATRSITPDFTVAAPVEYALYQNYPNPFNAVTTFVFDLKEAATVSLKLYNVAGQEVATILSADLSGGRHEVSFDASGLPSGMYLYRLDTPSFSAAKKMLLMK